MRAQRRGIGYDQRMMAVAAAVRDTGLMPRQTPRTPGADELAAKRVRWEREQRGWSTAELARRVTDAGMPIRQQAIWQIENREPPRRISLGEALALAEVFGISIYDLTEPPGLLVTAEVRMYFDRASELITHLEAVYREALELLDRVVSLPDQARPLLDYMGAEGFQIAEVTRLQDDLARAADLMLKVREELSKLD